VYTKGEISINDLIYTLKQIPEKNKTGAIAIYNGVVRGFTASNDHVSELIIESHVEKSNEILQNISADLEKTEGINKVIICHFIGKFEVGEDLVYVGIASGHRKELFPIYKQAIERYKTEGLFWKKEKTQDGKEHWIEK